MGRGGGLVSAKREVTVYAYWKPYRGEWGVCEMPAIASARQVTLSKSHPAFGYRVRFPLAKVYDSAESARLAMLAKLNLKRAQLLAEIAECEGNIDALIRLATSTEEP